MAPVPHMVSGAEDARGACTDGQASCSQIASVFFCGFRFQASGLRVLEFLV